MLLRSCTLLLLIALLTPTYGIQGALAQETVDSLRASADALTAKIQALDKEIAEYNKKISQTQGQAKTLKQALANLELQRASLAKEIERTQVRITVAQENILETQEKIVETQSDVSRNQVALTALLRSLVAEQDSTSMFTALLSREARMSDVLDKMQQGESISKAVGERVKSLRESKEKLASTKQAYEESKQKLESLHETLADQKQLVEQTTKSKSTLLVQTKDKESQYQQLLADRQKKKGDLELEMLDVESKLKSVVDASKLPKYGKGVLKYPVDNVTITQYFGNTPFSSRNPQVYNGAGHNGIDFSAKVGTPIYSAEAGVVLGTGNTDTACSGVSYGKWVLIRHNNGLTTLYAHLSVISVTSGEVVGVRQKIGLSGNTGYSTGPHLHFTVYASDAVHVSGPTEYKSKVCGTYMIMPLAPRAGYLNPLSYL